jgi:hypothetical protein
MTAANRFEEAVAAALRTRKEVTILTGPPEHKRATIIWIVVDDADRVLVRSVRGARGRWFRDLEAEPAAAIDLGDRVVPVTALPASDAERVQACSDGLRTKYAGNGSLASMLAADTLATTVQLVPA